MGEARLFERACAELERATALDPLAVRGTLRLALKSAGLEPATLTPAQLAVVIEQVLPQELRERGVADAESVCGELRRALSVGSEAAEAAAPTPEDLFRRLRSR